MFTSCPVLKNVLWHKKSQIVNVEIMKKKCISILIFDATIMICYVIISTSYLSYNYDLVCHKSDFLWQFWTYDHWCHICQLWDLESHNFAFLCRNYDLVCNIFAFFFLSKHDFSYVAEMGFHKKYNKIKLFL